MFVALIGQCYNQSAFSLRNIHWSRLYQASKQQQSIRNITGPKSLSYILRMAFTQLSFIYFHFITLGCNRGVVLWTHQRTLTVIINTLHFVPSAVISSLLIWRLQVCSLSRDFQKAFILWRPRETSFKGDALEKEEGKKWLGLIFSQRKRGGSEWEESVTQKINTYKRPEEIGIQSQMWVQIYQKCKWSVYQQYRNWQLRMLR